jgi:hypothetical protein
MAKRFSEFLLNESFDELTEASFKNILTFAAAATTHHWDEKQRRVIADILIPKINKFLPRFNSFRNAEAISNPDFNALKYDWSSIVESAMVMPTSIREEERLSLGIGDPPPSTKDYDVIIYDFLPLGSPNYIAGKLRKAEIAYDKTKNEHTKAFLSWYLTVLRELAPIQQMMDIMKTRVFKRQPKPPETRQQKFHNAKLTMAKLKSGPTVTKALTDLTDSLKGDYEEETYKWNLDWVERFDSISDDEYWDNYYDRATRTMSDQVYSLPVWDRTGAPSPQQKSLLRPRLKRNYKSIVRQMAKDEAERMQQDFLIKNVNKLVTIIDAKKANLAGDPQILKAEVLKQSFTGEIKFVFDDNSSFIVRNKVIWKRSQYGKSFNQYPTTFHDVVMPDGQPMGMPSEERMNKVFATV